MKNLDSICTDTIEQTSFPSPYEGVDRYPARAVKAIQKIVRKLTDKYKLK